MDVNDTKAGTYELVAERWDEITSKPGEPFDFVRHVKGDKVKLNVEDARRLVDGGAVVTPGEREKAAVEQAKAAYAAALSQVPAELLDQLDDAEKPEPQPSKAPKE